MAAMVRRHRVLIVILVPAAAVRLAATLAYRPALYFNDSFEYVGVARRLFPYQAKPDGYPLLLRLLEPAHSLRLVATLQHLLGLGVGIALYALLLRLRLPAWAAALSVAPPLLDGNIIQLEEVILSDTLFTSLLVAAAIVLLRHRVPTLRLAAAAGLLLAGAALTRTVGLPLIGVVVVGMLLRRSGWRATAALLTAAAVPLALYAGWYHSQQGRWSITGVDGVFLYARSTTFVDCRTNQPPADLVVLCPTEPLAGRRPAPDYVWHTDTPLRKVPGSVFDPRKNALAKRFATLAISRQPADYVSTVSHDVLRTFHWSRDAYPSQAVLDGLLFTNRPWAIPAATYIPGRTVLGDMSAYEQDSPATSMHPALVSALARYQDVVAVRGPMLAGLLMIGLAGLTLARRPAPGRGAGAVLLALAVTLIVLPPALTAYDSRYVLPSIPFASAAAALGAAALSRRGGLRSAQPPAYSEG